MFLQRLLCAFWSIASKTVDGNGKIRRKLPQFCKNVFLFAWGGFWIFRKIVNSQKGRWKHIFRISSDVADIYFLGFISCSCCRRLLGIPVTWRELHFFLHLWTGCNMVNTSLYDRTIPTCSVATHSWKFLSTTRDVWSLLWSLLPVYYRHP